MTLAHAALAQARAHRAALLRRLRVNLREQRLMSATLIGFMICYMIAAFVLVSRGLSFVQRMPLIGPILTERTLHLLFFFFFVMLIISNATITGMSLFRRSETGWLLSLPMNRAGIVLWKTIESLMLSSWGLILLSAPILAAFGQALRAGPMFYVLSMTGVVMLITIAANISTWLLLLLVRFFKPWWLRAAGLLGLLATAFLIFQMAQLQSSALKQVDAQANINQILRHTNLSTHPLLPSTWVTQIALSTSKGLFLQSGFYVLLLLSYAMVVWLVSIVLADKLFFPAWNRTLRHAEGRRTVGDSPWPAFRRALASRVLSWLNLSRPMRALVSKDARTFIREPAQWGQCALIFGLLLIYTSNLRNLGYNYNDPFWAAVLSYLNLTVCCLAMSTLTTRFVFPQFSMEGRRFWIVGLTPFPLTRVLRQKLLLNWFAATPLTALLIIISCTSLQLPVHRAVFFVLAMCLISIGLNALALSLGALLPNFRETNSAKIVSGFGGTLCLILSFFYIIVSICILIVPEVVQSRAKPAMPLEKVMLWEAAALLGVALVCLLAGGLPYFLAKKSVKELAYLGKL